MLIKRLSKIGLTLLLAVSFIVPSTFPARADFTSTDSTNLRYIKENTDNIYIRVGTSNTHLNNINTKLTNIYNDVGSIKNAVTNTIADTINTINTTLTSIKGYVDGIEGYIDGVEGKLDNIYGALGTSNSNWVTLGNYIDAMYQTMQTSDSTSTDIYNLLNNYTNGYLKDIRSSILILEDNIKSNRVSDTQQTITLNSNTTLGTVTYTLQPYVRVSAVRSEGRIVLSYATKYGTYRNNIDTKLTDIFVLLRECYNLVCSYFDSLLIDTEYIGNELHLTYQLVNDFKSSNHQDLTTINTSVNSFKSSFDSWVILWSEAQKLLYIYNDNILNSRISDTEDTINISSINNGNAFYKLRPYIVYRASFNSENHKFYLTNDTKYTNLRGLFTSYFQSITSSLNSYLSYLNDNSVANSISNNVAALDQNLTQLESAESAVTTSAVQRINNFLPDPSSIGSLSALAWGSNFLQRIFIALGAFNIPILCALVLSVCMQFIGYFKYKT